MKLINLNAFVPKGVITLLAFFLLVASPALSQSGGDYNLSCSTFGGGGTSAGGNYSLSCIIGRPEAGVTSGGDYELAGGFLPGPENNPPVADAGPDQVVECACNTSQGTKVTLDGTGSSDAEGDPLTYTWTGPFVESPANGPTPTVTLSDGCPGEYIITLVVNDGLEDSAPDDVLITVQDTTPPEFSLSVEPNVLWPPNHKMVLITPSWTVSDLCDDDPNVSLVSITINEGEEINTYDPMYDNTLGDGHTIDDIQIIDGNIYLRAERSGTGTGRVYTIIYQAADDSGNVTVQNATVTVPHDQT